MAISNRTVTIKNVFASTAETNIPNPPVPGQSYRNTNLTSEEVGQGWPFKEIVDSAKFNEAMYEYTTICQQLEKYGFLPWSANTDYPAGGCALGTNGNVYQAKQATGPSTASVDPVTDTSHTYWDLFYYGNVTANRALVSNGNGKVSASSTTATELGYVHGVTSAIQTQINNKADNNAVVHKAGDETINGIKTFTSNVSIATNNKPYIELHDNDVIKGNLPSSESLWNIYFQDKTSRINQENRIGLFTTHIQTSGTVWSGIAAYKNVANSTDSASIRVYYPTSGSPYTYAPTPTDTTTASGTQIATTGWVNTVGNNVVHLSGTETITGAKTFSSGVTLANNAWNTIGDDVQIGDMNNPGKLCIRGLNGYTGIYFYPENGNTPANGVYMQPDNYNGLCLTDTSSSRAWGSILCTNSYIRGQNGYYKLGNGLIIQWMLTSNITRSGTVITFPTPFTTENYAVCFNPYRSEPLNENATTVTERTASNCKVYGKTYDGGDMNCPCFVLAIGY